MVVLFSVKRQHSCVKRSRTPLWESGGSQASYRQPAEVSEGRLRPYLLHPDPTDSALVLGDALGWESVSLRHTPRHRSSAAPGTGPHPAAGTALPSPAHPQASGVRQGRSSGTEQREQEENHVPPTPRFPSLPRRTNLIIRYLAFPLGPFRRPDRHPAWRIASRHRPRDRNTIRPLR